MSKIFKTEIQEPPHILNVLVKHTVFNQDFWTRGFLVGDKWTVMTWNGTVKVPKDKIKEWTYLPKNKAFKK